MTGLFSNKRLAGKRGSLRLCALRRRGLLGSLLAACVGAMQFQGRAMAGRGQDQIELPAHRREMVSANGRFRLVIEALDGWRQLAAQATVQKLQGATVVTAWTQPIPQQLGPRQALVADDGRVLMIDEGINVQSRFALMLFDAQGRRVATHHFDVLALTAQATPAETKAHARSGTWMGPPAVLDSGGHTARVPFAGRTLLVSLGDGRLTLAR